MSHLQYIIEKCREKLWQDIVLASNDSWQERIDKENHNSEAREIHFRPITLQDILLCLWWDFNIDWDGWIKYETKPTFHAVDILEYTVKRIYPVQYNLTKSPYEQEEPILKFIAENLGFNSNQS
jgi:hypothetical protein